MKEEEILQNIGFLIFYGGVIMLEVVAALYLLLRRGNAIAAEVTSIPRLRQWAAAFLFACALSHLLWIFYANHEPELLFCGTIRIYGRWTLRRTKFLFAGKQGQVRTYFSSIINQFQNKKRQPLGLAFCFCLD